MRISEIFYSIQGEGSSVGIPMVFVRTAGCNLSCKFCDSSYASREKGEEWSLDQIFKEIYKYPTKRVCITGGEPVMQEKGFKSLLNGLFDLGYFVEVETNGTIRPTSIYDNIMQWNVSPKLSNSGNDLKDSINKDRLATFNLLPGIFKFVIGTEEDFQEAHQLICELDLQNVYLMPEGQKDEDVKKTSLWLIEKCKEHGYYFSPRLHIWLWGGKKGV